MLETQALWFFEAWYKETNMAFFQIQTKLFEKENPIRVKSIDINKFLRFKFHFKKYARVALFNALIRPLIDFADAI